MEALTAKVRLINEEYSIFNSNKQYMKNALHVAGGVYT